MTTEVMSIGDTNVYAQLMGEVEDEDNEKRKDNELEKLEKVVPDKSSCLEDDLLIYFFELLRLIGEDLAQRSEMEAKTQAGKREKTIWKQTLVDIYPLFRKLASRSLDPDVLAPLGKIMKELKSKQYTAADNTYLVLGKNALYIVL